MDRFPKVNPELFKKTCGTKHMWYQQYSAGNKTKKRHISENDLNVIQGSPHSVGGISFRRAKSVEKTLWNVSAARTVNPPALPPFIASRFLSARLS